MLVIVANRIARNVRGLPGVPDASKTIQNVYMLIAAKRKAKSKTLDWREGGKARALTETELGETLSTVSSDLNRRRKNCSN
jgi:hypothetical protein